MKIKNEGDGWICSKVKKATLWKNEEIRAIWQSVVNVWGNSERLAGTDCAMEEW